MRQTKETKIVEERYARRRKVHQATYPTMPWHDCEHRFDVVVHRFDGSEPLYAPARLYKCSLCEHFVFLVTGE